MPDAWRTALLTAFTMIAFAANSILCRLALAGATIDAASFTSIRLASGALLLAVLLSVRPGRARSPALAAGSWTSASMLFLYAVAFSFAYLSLAAGTGALILFGCVQATMLIVAIARGERPNPLVWLGLTIAVAGLVYLMLPGLTAPSPAGAALMSVAGIAWGVYSLLGRGVSDPIAATGGNFIRSVPFALAVSAAAVAVSGFEITPRGATLAVASGGIASGLGYVLWYAALRGLTRTRAATVQLSVPVIAALGGVVFLAEELSVRLVLSATMILGGVALTLAGYNRGSPFRR